MQQQIDHLLKDIPPEIFQTPVSFAFMTRGNDIYHGLFTYLLRQKHYFPRMSCCVIQSTWRPSCDSMFDMALKTPCDFIQVLDSDVAPRYDTTARLMMHDLDIVAAPIWMYDAAHNSLHLNYHTDEDIIREYTPKDPEVGVEEVFATCFGCLLVKRRVLETFQQTRESYTGWSPLVSEKFKNVSPDTMFCIKARELGFETYMDWAIEMPMHHKWVGLNASLSESYFAHRFLDREVGPEEKKRLWETPDGRIKLSEIVNGAPASEPV